LTCVLFTRTEGSSYGGKRSDHQVLHRGRTRPSRSLPPRDSTVARWSAGSGSRLHTMALPVARAERLQCRSACFEPGVYSGLPEAPWPARQVASLFPALDELLRA